MQPVVYVDTSRVVEGASDKLRQAMAALAEFVRANEPRIVTYDVFFSEDGARMTVIHVHPDAVSLEFHMEAAGHLFPPVAPFIEMESIDVYGEVGEELADRLRAKASMLGSGVVRFHAMHAGFLRSGAGEGP